MLLKKDTSDKTLEIDRAKKLFKLIYAKIIILLMLFLLFFANNFSNTYG